MKPKAILAAVVAACGLAVVAKLVPSNVPVATGKLIAPFGTSVNVDSFPGHVVLSPDGKFVAVSDFGFRQTLSILSASTGAVLSTVPYSGPTMYFGLSFDTNNNLYVSGGSDDTVNVFSVSDGGVATLERTISIPSGRSGELNFISGIALSGDGTKLYAVGNETFYHYVNAKVTEDPGLLNIVDISSGSVIRQLNAGGFPFDVTAVTKGTYAGKIYVSSELDDSVYSYLNDADSTPKQIATGKNAANLLLSADQSKLYVSNAASDTVSVISVATDTVLSTWLVRPSAERGLPGNTPLGMTLSPDGSTLYVALADMNAVATISTSNGTILGYIPTGWEPTSVVTSANGQTLFVTNAKGNLQRVPNATAVGSWGTYIDNILEGTVTKVNLTSAKAQQSLLTASVLAMNRFTTPAGTFTNPHVQHVIYVIKENRTYDSFFGDIGKGNGDASLCLFPQNVTPNQHALAERFVLLDNFFDCGQVSPDGWNWSTAGIVSDYTDRNVVYEYGKGGRGYDFEGVVNGFPADLYGQKDVAAPASGYLWDDCLKYKLSFRDYGCFVSDSDDDDFPMSNAPAKKNLVGNTDLGFREFDTYYADSDAWVRLGGKHPPNQLLSFGPNSSPSRISEFGREFAGFVKNKNLPALTMIRMPRDHTAGTSTGISTPAAMVADNDFAVGELVDMVSRSQYWTNTVICVVEDDTQAGQDHVDCHRGPALIISPYVKPGLVDDRFWNTDSLLRTMEELLGLPPMNQYDGFAPPIDVFSTTPENASIYTAIMPAASIINEVNSPQAYRAQDSKRLIARLSEHAKPDHELNDILWGDIQGPGKKLHPYEATVR